MNTEKIKNHIIQKIETAFNQGSDSILINALQISEELSIVNRYPMICSAMRKVSAIYESESIYTAPQGNGNNIIKYFNIQKKKKINAEEIVNSLVDLGGIAHYKQIYFQLVKRGQTDFSEVKDPLASVRNKLETNTQSNSYGKSNLFYSVFGVEAHKGIWGLVDYIDETKIDQAINTLSELEPEELHKATEGGRKLKQHKTIERDYKLPKKVKEKFLKKNGSLYCEVCGFDFFKTYGDLGNGYIEAHHIKPLSKLEKEEIVTENDFNLVCANCHRMLHRKGENITAEDLKKLFRSK